MIRLPDNFIFGIAESDLQTVGSLPPQQLEQAQKTMWEDFASKKGIDVPELGSFKYSNIDIDAKYITELGVKAYRTSISMSRTLDRTGKVNKKAIAWYRSYLQSLKKKGIEIHLCLYHWEAPERFIEKGILDAEFQSYYLNHVDIVLEQLSDLVDYFIPMNEPWCMSYLAYYRGIHAPGYQDLQQFFQAYLAAIDLQTRAIHRIKNRSNGNKIGIVNIHFPAYIQEQYTHKIEYKTARNVADSLTNLIFSDPFYKGTIDSVVTECFGPYLPKGYSTIINEAKLGGEISYYGINYYNSMYVKPANTLLGYDLDFPEGQLTNSLGWPISLPPHYPNGLTDVLVSYTNRYAEHNLQKIIVSENGTPAYTPVHSPETPQDDVRIFYINEHLKQVQIAIQKGAVVEGYFLWTLLDNYEWQEGYKPEGAFGLIHIDKKTGERTPKKSYYWFQKFLLNFYG